AALGCELQLVHEVVVHEVGALRVEQRGMDVDPDRRMLLAEIVGQLGVWHQVEPEQLHGRPPGGGAIGVAALSARFARPRSPNVARMERSEMWESRIPARFRGRPSGLCTGIRAALSRRWLFCGSATPCCRGLA